MRDLSRRGKETECALSCTPPVHWVNDPVDTSNGNLSYQVTDLSVASLGGNLTFQRSYASMDSGVARPLGYGWANNFDARIIAPITTVHPITVVLQTANSSLLQFFRVVSNTTTGTYAPDLGVTAALTRVVTGNVVTYTLVDKLQTTYVFTTSGALLSKRSSLGDLTTYTYGAPDTLTQVTDASTGRWLKFTYDQGRMKTVFDHSGRTITFTYDVNGDLVNLIDTRGLMWTYVYTGSHLLWKVIDPDLRTVVRTDFDAQGRAVAQYDGLDNRTVKLDFGLGSTRILTDARNFTSTDTYVGGTWIGSLDANSRPITRNYDLNFRPVYLADQNGNGTKMLWSPNGHNLERVVDAGGYTTTLQYDGLNNPTLITNTRNFTTAYVYSGTFLTRMIDAYGNTWIYTPTTDGRNLLKAEEAPGQRVTEYEYDQFGQRKVMTDALKNATRFAYDPVGRLITTTDAIGRITVNAYDNADRLIAVTNNYTSTSAQQNYLNTYNLITRYGYDGFGRQMAVTDTLNHVTRSYFDPAGRLISTTQNFSPTVGQNYLNTWNLITRYGYDAVGNQVAVTDTLGFVIRTDYDNLNRPVTVTQNYRDGNFNPNLPDEDIRRITRYDPAGNMLEQIDPLGNVTRNWYDSVNRVISTTTNYTTTPGVDPNTYNLTTWYEYDPAGQQVAITDTQQNVTRNYYDPIGRLISTTVNYRSGVGPNYLNTYNLTTRYEYDRVGNRVAITDALSTPTRYVYDKLNRVIATTNVSGTTATQYDAIGNRRVVTDALTHTTVYTYNAVGRLIAEGNPISGNITRYQYDALGRTIVVTDPLTHTMRTYYDDAGRVVSTTNALTGTTVITYNALGQRVGFLNENGKSSYTAYDGLGRTIVMTDATNSVMQYGYDAIGNRVVVTDALSHTTVYTYDAASRLIVQADALGNRTRFGYDGLGSRLVMTDANGVATRYAYDALNRLATVTESYTTTTGLDPNKYNLITRYGYDAIGNRTVMTNARGYTTTYTYDALSRLTATTDPISLTTRYVYDAVGNRSQVIDANNQTTIYTYDVLNRNTRIDYGTSLVTHAYDAVGNRTAMTDSLGVTRYLYDELNRLKQVTDPFTGTVQYRYDAVGNRTQTIYPDGKVVTYTFDAANRLTGTLSWDGQLTTYAFDKAGRLITTTLPNGLQTVNVYDAANRIIRLTHSRSSTPIGDYQFALDALGNRTVATESMQSPGSGGGMLGLSMSLSNASSQDAMTFLTSSSGRRRPGRVEPVPPELLRERPPRAPDAEDLLTPTLTPTPQPTRTSAGPSASELRLISWQPDRAPVRLKTANTTSTQSTTARVTVLQQSGGSFPSTLVIDDFNRPDGPIGRLWFSHTSGYTITNQQLGYVSGHSIYWNAWFGPTQEAYVTLATVDNSSTAELDLYLKVQDSYYGQGAIIVSYLPSTHVVQVFTTLLYDNIWEQHGSDIPATFQANDVFGARARADGIIEVYQNGTLLSSVDASSWPFYALPGRVGLAVYDAPAMRLDNFGAGGVSDAVSLAPLSGIWKYLDNGTDQGTTWRTAGFDDSSWKSGTGQFGYGDGDETTVVGYGSDPNNKYITTYFRRTFTVGDPAQYQNLLLRLQRDDGAVVYLNGSEVFRSNMPSGTITYTTRAASDVGGDAEIHYFTATVPITALVSGTNLIAVEVHQWTANSSDLSFDLELLGTPLVDSLLPVGSTWKYLDNGSDQGTAWRSPSFNDSAWSTGAAELGYGDGDERTVISYGPDPNNKYITTYFRKAITVTNPARYQRLWLQLLADDGAIVYVNGTEAARVNLASGTVMYTTRAIAPLNEPEEARFNLFYLAPSLLVTGTNVVAVEVHQQVTNTSDCSFDLALLGQTAVTAITTTTVVRYGYDPLSRLTNANYSGAYTYTFGYGYDAVGNRTIQTRTITSTQVITYQYDTANRMTKAGGVNYTWDNNGNLINDGSATYLYDRANRMVSTTLSGVTSLYAYNGDGARLKQIVAGVVTTYTQDLVAPLPVVLQAKTGAATTPYLYAIGTRPLGQYTSAWEYLLPDALGSVRQIVDANGNVTLAKSYEPYGTVLTSTGTASSIFAYTGEQIDTTGLIYLRARYLNPRLGIFLARDPWSGEAMQPITFNGYIYGEQNPILLTDPSGKIPCPICWIIILLLAGGCGSSSGDSCTPPTGLGFGDVRNNPRSEILTTIQQKFEINLPPGFHFEYGATERPNAAGETPWFRDKKIVISELAFTGFSGSDYNAFDIASTMVHEAVHAWQEYSLEQYAESGVLSQFPSFKSENPYYRTSAWRDEYLDTLEVQAEEYVNAHSPAPLCLSKEMKDNIGQNIRKHPPESSWPEIPGTGSKRIELLNQPLP